MASISSSHANKSNVQRFKVLLTTAAVLLLILFATHGRDADAEERDLRKKFEDDMKKQQQEMGYKNKAPQQQQQQHQEPGGAGGELPNKDDEGRDVVRPEANSSPEDNRNQQQEPQQQHQPAGAASEETTEKIVSNFRTMSLEDLAGDKWDREPHNPRATCELMLMGNKNCRVKTGKETAEECIYRLGFGNWHKVMPSKCRNSRYWKGLEKQEADESTRKSRMSLEADGQDFLHLRDKVVREQYYHSSPEKQDINPKRGLVAKDPKGDAFNKKKYRPPHMRSVADYGPPRSCSKPGTFVHPISFGVPEGNVVDHVSRLKFFGFLPYTPRLFPPWKFPPGPYRLGPADEYLADLLHEHSYFAFTHKRGGWDCLRHVEILANGAVPFWSDLELCGRYCMAVMPKQMLFEAMELPGVEHIGRQKRGQDRVQSEFYDKPAGQHLNFKKPGRVDFEKFDEAKYYDLADRLLNYTKHHLTTTAMVSYILKSIGYEEPKSVLLIQPAHQDFLTQGVESGLGDLGIVWTTNLAHEEGDPQHRAMLRVDLDDPSDNHNPTLPDNFTIAEFEAARTRRGNIVKLHGVGAVNGMRLWNPLPHRRMKKERLGQALRSKEFDLVIYTQWHGPPERLPYWHDVKAGVPLNRVVVMDGADDRKEPVQDTKALLAMGINVFRREMNDHADC